MSPYLSLLPIAYLVFAGVDRISVRGTPAEATLGPETGERQLLQLPDLDFKLRISAYCANATQPDSISISVADTATTLRGDDLPSTWPVEASVRVSARQLAPIALRGFCSDRSGARRTLLVPSVLTAQVSLRCKSDTRQSTVSIAEPLDVQLSCEAPGPAPD